ncbi:hypothetical protein DV738_g3331, partial [Chaetothyriales sp. CBS 135597]
LDLDFEATLDRIQQLEADLAEVVQSSKLVREQIRREEAAAARDREAYRVLEAGARSEQGLAREQARKVHPDEQLKTLVVQLRSHVGSIARNTAPLAGVSDALDDAEQALWELMATTRTDG